jgi:hypothetical protein
MGFVKGTDGIASTLRNTLEGSVGNIALENISATTEITTPALVVNSISSDDSSFVNIQDGLNVQGDITVSDTVSATGNITGGNVSAAGNISGNTAGFAIGYRDIPQVSLSANAIIATADAGKHFYSTSASNLILTIANNASQAFQTGSALTIVNQGTGNITVAQGSGVTLYLAGNSTSGNRTISTFGMATCIKVATNTWFINGTGVA